MKVRYASYFKRSYSSLSEEIKKKFKKQINYLLDNIRHPSLRAKKYDEESNVWQARVNQKYRFYFLIEKDAYVLLDIKPHE